MIKIALLMISLGVAVSAPASAGGNAAAGKQKAQACAGCHGEDGKSPAPQNPNLAGQYESYLLHALQEYKSGGRNNSLMKGMVEGLSKEDMKDLAAWFASQKGLEIRY